MNTSIATWGWRWSSPTGSGCASWPDGQQEVTPAGQLQLRADGDLSEMNIDATALLVLTGRYLGSTFGRCRHLLNDRGIYLSSELGPYSQNLLLAVVTPLLRGRRVVFPLPKENAQIVAHLKELMEKGEFTPVIDRRYRLDEIIAAYRYVESGRKVGSVVITIVEPDSRGRQRVSC